MYPVTADERASQSPEVYTVATWWDAASVQPEATIRQTLLKRIVTRGDLVFDIGANRGTMTLQFRRMGAYVVAVEPLADVTPQHVKEFFFMFRYDPLVALLPVAISDHVGTQCIRIHKTWPYLSTLDGPWVLNSAHKDYYAGDSCEIKVVHTITLDDMIDAFGMPAFIKIDVEGHENTVIRGLTRTVPSMSLEYHEDWVPHESLAHMQSLAERANTTYVANYTFSKFEYNMPIWMPLTDMCNHLKVHVEKSGPHGWGDIYLVEVNHARNIGLDAHKD